MTVDATDTTSGDPPTADGTGATHHRYPGSPPFGDDDLDRQLFRGRDAEADIVLHSILSANLFLLYSQSGLGKSSLLNARVMDELRRRGRWPVAVRLNDTEVAPVEAIRAQIEEVAAADPTVELVTADRSEAPSGATGLWDALSTLEVWRGNELQELVVVLDQFEELFTLQHDEAARRAFIRQFGEIVRGHRHDAAEAASTIPPKARFVVVVREDSLGELQAVENDVPQILRNRFRLLPLDRESARAAIVEPARLEDERLAGPPFEYSEAAITEILDFLSASTTTSAPSGGSIDPSQLQIVCQYIERTIVPRKTAGSTPVRIDAADLEGRAGLDQILSRFYRRTIESLPGGQVHQAEELCERGLINRGGRRLSLEQGQIVDEFSVTPATLQALVDGRLLRADPRVGSVYYELAHDTLVPAILADREARLARRRRRRNRVLAIIGAVLVLAVLIATAVVASSSGGSEPAAVVAEPTVQSLSPGTAIDDRLDSDNPSREFAVTAPTDGYLEVLVEPAPELDVAVVATDAAGGTRLQDQLGNGGAERMVIPPVAGDDGEYRIQVTSLAPPDSTFRISTAELDPVGVEVGAVEAGTLAEQGDAIVYALTLAEGDEVIVDVDPRLDEDDATDASSETEAKATLDPTIEVIDSTSETNRPIVDAGGPGVVERAIVSRPGQSLVVVRGKSTAGAFTIAVGDKSPEVPVGDTAAGAIDEVGATSEFTFTTDPGAVHAVLVAPELQFDAVLGITSGSDPRSVDRVRQGQPELALVAADDQRVDLEVSGFESSVGSFDLSVSGASTAPTPDVGVAGAGLQVYDVPLATGASALVTVAPSSADTEIELTSFAPDGTISGTALSSAELPATLTVSGAEGVHHVVVVPRSTAEGGAPSDYLVTVTSEQAYVDAFGALLDDIAALESRTAQYTDDRAALESQLFGDAGVADPGPAFQATLDSYQQGHSALADQYLADVQPMVAALDAKPLQASPFGDLDRVRDAAVRHYRSWLDYVPEYQTAIELWTFDVLNGRTNANFIDYSQNRLRSFIQETDDSFFALCGALRDEQPSSGSFSERIANECKN